MSNYTQIVSYGPKDTLSLNDTNKFIKGVQFDAEFQAIATAITSKNDTTNLPTALGSGVTSYLTASATQIKGWGPNNGALVDFTPDTNRFLATWNGFSGTVQVTCTWCRIGPLVALNIPAVSGTSNGTQFSCTASMPVAILPTTSQTVEIPSACISDNGAQLFSGVSVQLTSSGFFLLKNGNVSGWTTSGTKAFTLNTTVYWLLV